MAQGANLNFRDGYGQTPLFYVGRTDGDVKDGVIWRLCYSAECYEMVFGWLLGKCADFAVDFEMVGVEKKVENEGNGIAGWGFWNEGNGIEKYF